MSQSDAHPQPSKAALICKDPRSIQAALQVFESEGYETLTWQVDKPCPLGDGASPSAILLDAAAAPEDPLAFCREIRQMPGCELIPLLLLSEQGDPEEVRRAYDAGVTTVFAKPLDEEAFRHHVVSLGDTGRTLSGIRALRMPESKIFMTMPDAFFVAGSDGLLRQYLGGGGDDPLLHAAEIEGQLIADVWPAEIAEQVCRNIRRALKTRDGCAMQFELQENDLRCNYELRLMVQGRDRVLLIVRNLGDSGAVQPAQAGRDHSSTLTGLTTVDVFKGHFDEILAQASLRERGVAVFCIGIDHFARIKKTLGHAVGSSVLQVTAQRIERCLRTSDKLARISDTDTCNLARISGDEFVLVLTDIETREDIATVASRVQDAFAEPVTIDEHQLKIAPSIGIAIYPLDGKDSDSLLKNARIALDEAKANSVEGREFYSSTMRFGVGNRLDVKNELSWAIENQQLELHYLPRIDLRTGQVAGLEALLRWIHPLRGSVPMSEVIPLAEATDLIYPIGEWVLSTACQQASAWRQDRADMPVVSINLSKQEFSRENLAELVQKALLENELPAELLELELTEAMLMRMRQAETKVQELNALGVGIVLDDFGQGQSSIAHLTSMRIKAIKIDRAFIEGAREPGEKQSICAAMIAMSRELGITVIAEGVENELQVQFLKERGCDAVQGFLYTEPLPAVDVPVFIDACREVAEESKVIDLDTVRIKMTTKTAS
jgi:diguanylate cyclase (GGDEF)-like protein